MTLVADAVHAGTCRTFAVETAATGQREFIVTSAQRFWDHYTLLTIQQRHHYEIIRQATPCNLYFGECLQLTQVQLCTTVCRHLCSAVAGFEWPPPLHSRRSWQYQQLHAGFRCCFDMASTACTNGLCCSNDR